MIQPPLPGLFENTLRPDYVRVRAEYFTELSGHSCILWSVDGEYISSAHGKTPTEAKNKAVKKAEGQ